MPSNLTSLVPPAWREIVDLEDVAQIGANLGQNFLPSSKLIFKSLEVDPDDVKVVIVGQDPYPNSQHAMGLAFSVPAEVGVLPASLKNIYKELEADLGIIRENGDLSAWLEQGVLLLNMSLTVLPNESGSHSKIGWQVITQQIISDVAKRGAVAVLWGREAQLMSKYFAIEDQFIAPHPSPLSVYRGFYGSKPFSKVNSRLVEKGLTPIKW
ncbi:uracil-DNA glycosylase [Candidatus Nanopelagicus limnes]|uniref:Uracil-DNA glycosylase n=1 Tax=Candidatus Nanopelagicus limnae TaxID=1884634 RepID=A0A249JXW0_9ACTN|nr:uracil-DNA glycosylase [Candidatus Nanopelagicus limnes]ASY09355.1 uracil-DNA glycosylase [Candidatus Nanopelagicus limnes]